MAKRRMVIQDINVDEAFNALSIEAQLVYLRMLPMTDDFGIVPANLYTLGAIVNPPERIKKNLKQYLDEIVGEHLGYLFAHAGRIFFVFNPGSFDAHQNFVINKRTRSEYLREKEEDVQGIFSSFLESPGNTRAFYDAVQASIERESKSERERGGMQGGKPAVARLSNEAIYDALEIPESLHTDAFRTAMLEWIANRRGKGAPSGGWAKFFQKQINSTLTPLAHDEAVAMLSYSAEMGYQGLFARKPTNGHSAASSASNGLPLGYHGMHELEPAKQHDPGLMERIAICKHTDGRQYWTRLSEQRPVLDGYHEGYKGKQA